MKREDISTALGGIDDTYIEEAAELRSARRPVRRWARVLVPMAACLAVVFSLGLYRSYLYRGMKAEGPDDGPVVGESGTWTGSAESGEGQPESEWTVKVRVEQPLEDSFLAVLTEPALGYEAGTRVEVRLRETEQDPDAHESNREELPIPAGTLVEATVIGFTQTPEKLVVETDHVTILEN